jgi:hypothetical protein
LRVSSAVATIFLATIKIFVMMLSYYKKTLGKSVLLQALLITILGMQGFCINRNVSTVNKSTVSLKEIKNKNIRLSEYLQCFYPLQSDAGYSVTICADLPVNDDPGCVYKKGEPGHVFLILSKQNPVTMQVITRSFGFYPRVPVTFLIKQVRSRILENCNREYNASIEKKLTADEFAIILKKCMELSKKKYNLKKYNCYEYVLEVFNSLPGIEKLPVTKVKFPFIFGKGGSPCSLYSDLKKLLANGSAWVPFIKFGLFKSPYSDSHENQLTSH